MDCSTPGFPIHHQLSELAQTHVHWASDAIQPSHPLSSPSPPPFNLSQHQGHFPKSQFFTSGGQTVKTFSGLLIQTLRISLLKCGHSACLNNSYCSNSNQNPLLSQSLKERVSCICLQSLLTASVWHGISLTSLLHGRFSRGLWKSLLNISFIWTFVTKVCIAKAIVFPVVMYGCES